MVQRGSWHGCPFLVSGGADKFNGVLGQMVDSAGATETAYATMTDTFQHSMDSLQTTAENLSIDCSRPWAGPEGSRQLGY